MLDTLKIFDDLKETMDASAARKIAEVMGMVYEELRNTVTKEEFNELKDVVTELAEAQKRTEQRVEELAEAQKRTEQRVEELAEAQKRTEEEVRGLAISLKETQKMVGGLSDTVGYGLEDRAMMVLPGLLKERYNIDVVERLRRRFLIYNGNQEEVNIYGKGIKEKEDISIIGEAKAQLSKRHIERFLKMIGRLEENDVISGKRFLFLVTYLVEPDIEEYARKNGIEVIWSYDLPYSGIPF